MLAFGYTCDLTGIFNLGVGCLSGQLQLQVHVIWPRIAQAAYRHIGGLAPCWML